MFVLPRPKKKKLVDYVCVCVCILTVEIFFECDYELFVLWSIY